MITRPGSPQACRSTARIVGPRRAGEGGGGGGESGVRRRCRGHAGRGTRWGSTAALGVGHLARDVALRVAVRDVAAPVVELLAASQAELQLRPAREVMYSRSGTIVWPFALVRPRSSSISERWRSSFRVRSARGCSGCLLERRDVGPDQPRLALLDPGVGIGEVDLARPDRLDLGSGQDDAGLERLVDRELVARSPVEGDVFSSAR